MNDQRSRYIFPAVAIGLVIVCLSAGSFIPRTATAAESREQGKEKDKGVEIQKPPGVPDKEIDDVKKEFGPDRSSLPRRGANREQEKPELHEHQPCEELHPSAAVEDCKKRREQSR